MLVPLTVHISVFLVIFVMWDIFLLSLTICLRKSFVLYSVSVRPWWEGEVLSH